MSDTTRDPVLDQCDAEIAKVLEKYGKAIQAVPFIGRKGEILAQVVYFDALKEPVVENTSADKDNLEKPQ